MFLQPNYATLSKETPRNITRFFLINGLLHANRHIKGGSHSNVDFEIVTWRVAGPGPSPRGGAPGRGAEST